MGELIHVDFPARKRIIRREDFMAAAERCERAARGHDGKTAGTLTRLAARYRAAANG